MEASLEYGLAFSAELVCCFIEIPAAFFDCKSILGSNLTLRACICQQTSFYHCF
ncbi:hypothetical protein Plhal304r1_c031g0101231 [Plasmopara halstedii]